eukprot:3357863-Prymnesium_polylepis.1
MRLATRLRLARTATRASGHPPTFRAHACDTRGSETQPSPCIAHGPTRARARARAFGNSVRPQNLPRSQTAIPTMRQRSNPFFQRLWRRAWLQTMLPAPAEGSSHLSRHPSLRGRQKPKKSQKAKKPLRSRKAETPKSQI